MEFISWAEIDSIIYAIAVWYPYKKKGTDNSDKTGKML